VVRNLLNKRGKKATTGKKEDKKTNGCTHSVNEINWKIQRQVPNTLRFVVINGVDLFWRKKRGEVGCWRKDERAYQAIKANSTKEKEVHCENEKVQSEFSQESTKQSSLEEPNFGEEEIEQCNVQQNHNQLNT
jgi:hypothetical protein